MRIATTALLTELGRVGVRLRAGAGRLVAEPGRSVTPALADGLRAWKPELVRVVGRLGGLVTAQQLASCAACGCEFVVAPEPCCPWCAAAIAAGRFSIPLREVELDDDSTASEAA